MTSRPVRPFSRVITVTGLLLSLTLSEPGAAQNRNGPPPAFKQEPITQTRDFAVQKTTISAAGAQHMIDAVTAEAERQHNAVTVVIVDDSANIVAVKRMDGANLGSLQAALAKAVSAAKLQIPTGTFLEDGAPNVPIATAFISAGFTLLAGGEPIKSHGKSIGAIAVSGTGDDKLYISTALHSIGL